MEEKALVVFDPSTSVKVSGILPDALVAMSPDAESAKAKLIAEARTITTVFNQETLEGAVKKIRALKGFSNAVETARLLHFRKLIDVKREGDQTVNEFRSELDSEATRLDRAVRAWEMQKKRNQDAADLKEKQEREAQEAILRAQQAAIDKKRQEAENARVEALRLAHEAEQQKGKEAGKTLNQAGAALAQSEAARLEAIELENQREAALLEAESVAMSPVVAMPVIASIPGYKVKEELDYEVLTGGEIQFARAFPHLCKIELKRRDIIEELRKGGASIFSVTTGEGADISLILKDQPEAKIDSTHYLDLPGLKVVRPVKARY